MIAMEKSRIQTGKQEIHNMAEQEEKRLIQSGETEQGKTEGHRADRLAGCIIIALLAGMLPCLDAAAGDMAEWANPRNIRTCLNIQSRHLPESNFQTHSGSEETVETKNGIKKNGNTKNGKNGKFGRQDWIPYPKSDFFRQAACNIWEKDCQFITADEYAELTSIQIDTSAKTLSFQLNHGAVQTMSYGEEIRMDTADLAVFTGLEWISTNTKLYPGDLQGLEGLFGLYAQNTIREMADIIPYPEAITELGIADRAAAGEADGKGEKDLDGIERFPNLTYLSADYAALEDISALQKFPGLQGLMLEGCSALSDYSPLASLVNLEWLKIASGSLEHIDFVGSMGRLAGFSIEGSRVKSLDMLKGCDGLTFLNLTDNPMIEDYAVIGQLCGLEELTLEMGHGGRLPSFERLVKLERLSLKDVEDLSPLKDAASVISLFLDHCSGTQLDAVAAMQQLNTLEIHRFSTKVESLSSLTVLSNLVSLHLHDVAVNGNIEALFGIPSLKSLHLDGCRVGINFARLPVNENLEILSMNGIRITDGSETEGEGGKNGDEIRLSEHYEMFDCFPNLTELYLESLGLEDIAFTGRLPHLRHLDVRDNPVASLKELQGLEEIRTVWYGGGTIVFP